MHEACRSFLVGKWFMSNILATRVHVAIMITLVAKRAACSSSLPSLTAVSALSSMDPMQHWQIVLLESPVCSSSSWNATFLHATHSEVNLTCLWGYIYNAFAAIITDGDKEMFVCTIYNLKSLKHQNMRAQIKYMYIYINDVWRRVGLSNVWYAQAPVVPYCICTDI